MALSDDTGGRSPPRFPPPGPVALRAWLHLCETHVGHAELALRRAAPRIEDKVRSTGPDDEAAAVFGDIAVRLEALVRQAKTLETLLGAPSSSRDGGGGWA